MDALRPLPDFDAMSTAIAAAGIDAMNPVGELNASKRLELFKHAIREVLDLRADAIRFGFRLKPNPEVKCKAHKTRSRAERRIGQFLIEMERAGLRDPGHSEKGRK